MGQMIFDMAMSLDGFVRASNPTPDEPLGEARQTDKALHIRNPIVG